MERNKNWSPNTPRIKNSVYKGYIAVDDTETSVRELKRKFIKKHGIDGKIISDVLVDCDMWFIKNFYKSYTYHTLDEIIEIMTSRIEDFDVKYREAKLKYINSVY